MALLAGAAVFTACQQKEEDLGPAKVTVSPVELAFGEAEGSKTVELTATRDWTIQDKPDWVALNVESGKASSKTQTITVSVNENKDYDRSDDIVFTIGLSKASLSISQKGPKGEYSTPQISCAEFIKRADPNTEYILVGTVASAVNTTYCSFDLNDGTGTVVVWTVNNKDEWKDIIKKGGTVKVRGKYMLYTNNGSVKHEMVDAYIESFEGAPEATTAEPQGTGSESDPFNVSAAIAKAKETGETATSETYYIKGKIQSVDEQYGTQYGNATFIMVDEGYSAVFKAFRILYFNNKRWTEGGLQVKEGDEVIVCGKIVNYQGEEPETAQGSAYLYSLNGEKGKDTPQGEITASTVSEFIAKADPNTYYRLTGTVSAFKTGTNSSGKNWMQFNLTDATGTILVYGFKDGEYDKWATTVKDGGTVTLTGTYQYYESKQQHEVMETTIESFTGGSDTPGDEIAASTVSEFIAKADPNTYYRLTGTVSDFKTGTSSAGKNWLQFNLTDATGTILVYGFKDGEYDKWATKVKDGGTVTLTGTYQYYESKQQHEVMNTVIESYTDGGGSQGDDETPGPAAGTGTESDPFNVAAAIAKALETGEEATADAYYIKGTVTGTPDVSAQYHNATFDIIDPGFESAVFKVFRVKSFDGADFDGTESIKAGDVVVVYAKIFNYKGNTPETEAGGSFISINGKTEFDKAEGGDATGTFANNVEWSLDSSAYTQDAKVNGTEGVTILKLGTGSKYGTATLTLPDGATKLSFYAVSWNNAEVANLVFKVDGKEVATKTPAANSGLKGNPTYELTVTDSDYYTVDLKSAAKTVTVETSGGYRAALFGIQAK